MQEQRLTARLTKYWQLLRREGDVPDIRHFNAAAVDELWPYCFRIGIIGQGLQPLYKYEYMGEALASLYGRNMTGTTVDGRMADFPGAALHKKLPEVIKQRAPLQDDGHFVDAGGRLVKYRACLLPFANAKQGFTHIVVGLSCRKF